MSHPIETPFRSLQYYLTAPYACSYLEDRESRSQVAAPTHLIDTPTYAGLVEQGFRRSGLFTYRPRCDTCMACRPIRVDTLRFQPTRTQRKTWKRHRDLQARLLPLHWKPEHFDLYQHYQSSRHPGAGMDEDSRAQYTQFLLTSRVDSRLIEFRDTEGLLAMVSIVDMLPTGLSSVYTFYDPDCAGSLGTYGILWQIQHCKEAGLPWLYLGYWIPESRKMAYKSQFRPHQILRGGLWMENPTP